MALDLDRKANKVELKINTIKTKILSLTGYRTSSIYIKGLNIGGTDQFVYLGSVLSTGDDSENDVTRCINNITFAFPALYKICKCRYVNANIKLKWLCLTAPSLLLYANCARNVIPLLFKSCKLSLTPVYTVLSVYLCMRKSPTITEIGVQTNYQLPMC